MVVVLMSIFVIAQTSSEKGHKGINAFIVEKGAKGFDVGQRR